MTLAGRYRILSRIGKGGMGLVYAAEEESLGIRRLVAIKVLPPQMTMDEDLAARFREEIKIVSALDHPHIVPVYSLGEIRGVYFYVMKLLDGQTAYQKLQTDGPFPEEMLRRTMAPIARALHYAHSKGVIHRDIKSNNIHIGVDGQPTLMDFGVARSEDSDGLTTPGQIVGTTACMSPEQWMGHAEPRSDVYSLGVVLFELAAGVLPFQSKQPYELMKMHLEAPPPPLREWQPKASAELESIVRKCMAKSPDGRYRTAQEVAEALERPYRLADAGAAPAVAEPAAYPMDQSPAAMETAHTALLPTAAFDLAPADPRLWRQCEAADEAFARGELRDALNRMHAVERTNPNAPAVRERLEKFAKMIALTDQLTARADRALADHRLKEAIGGYQNVLRCAPIPAIAAKLLRAREQSERAEEFLQRAQREKRAGNQAKAIKLAAKAFRLNREIDPPADDDAPRPSRKQLKQSRGRRKPIYTKDRLAAALLTAAALLAAFSIKPWLRAAADRAFRANSDYRLFLSPYSANRLYRTLREFPWPPPETDLRLQVIALRAKTHYIDLANDALRIGDLATAIKNLKEALVWDPADVKIFDSLATLETKYEVQKSLARRPSAEATPSPGRK
jgi:hypothetical protein